MGDMQLDEFTTDRLLAARFRPDDVPAGYEGLARLIEAVRKEPAAAELAREKDTIAAMSAVLRSRSSRSHRRRRDSRVSTRLKVVAVTLVAMLALGTGLAFGGSLPDSFQKVASSVLGRVGIDVPGPDTHAGSHPSTNTTAPPQAALFGLCTAWQSGQGGANGNKDQATAFAQLSASAGTAGVQDFCTGVITAHNAAHPATDNSSPSNNGTSTADTKSGGRSSTGQSHKP